MSDDLISREEALERLQLLRKFNMTKAIQITIDAVEMQINFCKTAFDKEKVIEELKEEGCIVDDDAGNRAVEIIEKGGIE